MVNGETGQDDGARLISRRVVGMVFLGTPFREFTKHYQPAKHILEHAGVRRPDRAARMLGVESDQIYRLNEAFSKVLRQRTEAKNPLRVVFFHETLGTNGALVVSRESAMMANSDKCHPIQASHHAICQFSSERDPGYQAVLEHIEKFIDMADIEPSDDAVCIATCCQPPASWHCP